MDPYEPIFLNNSNGIRPKTFVYTDVVDDETVASDMTWSSYKIQTELNKITQNQVAPINTGLPGQLLRLSSQSEPEWADLSDIIHMMTNEEIDTIFTSPERDGLHLPSLSVTGGVLHVDGWSYEYDDQ